VSDVLPGLVTVLYMIAIVVNVRETNLSTLIGVREREKVPCRKVLCTVIDVKRRKISVMF